MALDFKKSFIMVLSTVVFFSFNVFSQDKTKKKSSNAWDLVVKVAGANRLVNEESEVTMKLMRADGEVRAPKRKLNIFISNPKEGETRTLLEILAPKDLRGSRFLTIESPKASGQWVYLLSTKKVERLTAGNDYEKVFDSDLSYSDLKGEDNGSNVYVYVFRDEWLSAAKKTCGEDVDLVLSLPKRKSKSPYKKRVLAISKKRPIVCRIDLLNMKDELLKSIESFEYKNRHGVWRPTRVLVTSYEVKDRPISKTEILFLKRKVDVKFDNKMFTPGQLAN